MLIVLKWCLIVAAIFYLGGLAALYFQQRAMLFPAPTRARTAPAAAGFPEAEEHVLTTADGERVIVWHVPAKPGHPVVLYFHGNGDFLAGFFPRFRDLIADGTGIVALSYRGYAGSSGTPSEQGLLQDADAAYAFTAAHYAPERIVAWGFSLGTGVAVALASEHKIGKLILEAPYASTVDIASALPTLRFVPVRLLMLDQFRSDQRIARVNVPLLVMHGTNDHVIPLTAAEHLFALAHQPKQFARFEGGGHENLDRYGAMMAARRFIGD